MPSAARDRRKQRELASIADRFVPPAVFAVESHARGLGIDQSGQPLDHRTWSVRAGAFQNAFAKAEELGGLSKCEKLQLHAHAVTARDRCRNPGAHRGGCSCGLVDRAWDDKRERRLYNARNDIS